MRYKTKERRKHESQAHYNRTLFRTLHLRCWVCRQQPTSEIHEICRGASRKTAYMEPCTWVAVCGDCHMLLGDYASWPLARQYALKRHWDRENYDRVRMNRIRGRADDAISEDEVRIWVESMAESLDNG